MHHHNREERREERREFQEEVREERREERFEEHQERERLRLIERERELIAEQAILQQQHAQPQYQQPQYAQPQYQQQQYTQPQQQPQYQQQYPAQPQQQQQQYLPQQQPQYQQQGQGFNPRADAEVLANNMRGFWSTKDGPIIPIFGARTSAQLAAISQEYKAVAQKDLFEEVNRDSSGLFQQTLFALLTPPAQYDAEQLHHALHHTLGVRDRIVTEIVCTRNPQEVRAMQEAYRFKYQEDCATKIQQRVSGHLGRLYLTILQSPRVMPQDPAVQAPVDVNSLYHAGEGRMMGSDSEKFVEIIGNGDRAYLDRVYLEYARVHGHALDHAIDKRIGGELGHALKAAIEPYGQFFCKLITKSEGVFSNDNEEILRVICTQRERHLREVNEFHLRTHGKSIRNVIEREWSGAEFRHLISQVLQHFAE